MSSFWSGVHPADLVPGNPVDLDDLARQLGTLGTGLTDAVNELTAINGGAWKGSAADAFRHVVSKQPERYADAGNAFRAASNAVSTFAGDLTTAQHTAQIAITMWYVAEKQTQTWLASSVSHVGANATDPGAAGRAAAEEKLNAALAELRLSAARASQALTAAKQGAPSKPSLFDDLVAGVASISSAEFKFGVQFIEGVGDGVTGIFEGLWDVGKFAWSISPMRAMIDPIGWAKTVISDGKTVYTIGDYAVHHPVSFAEKVGKGVSNLTEWEHDPGKALGELVPAVVLAVATAGLGTGAAVTGEAADDLADAASVAAEASDSLDTVSAIASITGDGETADVAAEASNALFGTSDVLDDQAAALNSVSEATEGAKSMIEGVSDVDKAAGVVRALDVSTTTPDHGEVAVDQAAEIGTKELVGNSIAIVVEP